MNHLINDYIIDPQNLSLSSKLLNNQYELNYKSKNKKGFLFTPKSNNGKIAISTFVAHAFLTEEEYIVAYNFSNLFYKFIKKRHYTNYQ